MTTPQPAPEPEKKLPYLGHFAISLDVEDAKDGVPRHLPPETPKQKARRIIRGK